MRLKNEGYKFKAIYNLRELGKCKKNLLQAYSMGKRIMVEEISNSTVGICPSTHFTGIIQKNCKTYYGKSIKK